MRALDLGHFEYAQRIPQDVMVFARVYSSTQNHTLHFYKATQIFEPARKIDG